MGEFYFAAVLKDVGPLLVSSYISKTTGLCKELVQGNWLYIMIRGVHLTEFAVGTNFVSAA